MHTHPGRERRWPGAASGIGISGIGISGIGISDLYRETLPDAIRYANWLCREWRDGDESASDIVHDAIEVVYRCRSVTEETFRPLLFQTIQYLFRNHRRLRERRWMQSIDITSGKEMSDKASGSLIVHTLIELTEVLWQLNADEREVLLYEYMGLTTSEISVIAGCGIRAMEKRIARARVKAQRYLRGEKGLSTMAIQSTGDLRRELERLLEIAKERIPDIQERTERRGRKPKR